MFENYIASLNDLKAIEEGIKHVWNPKLDFIFKNKRLFEDLIVISYDSKNFYLWKHKNFKVSSLKILTFRSNLQNYELFKLPHELKIPDKYQEGWLSGFSLEKLIPIDKAMLSFAKELRNVWIISGPLVAPFISFQQLKSKQMTRLNPYTTYESYLATIIHEFGHTYFNKHLTWWFSDKKDNLNYLHAAQNLYEGRKTKNSHQNINIPNYDKRQMILTEIFAFCTDYSAASFFWKKHKKIVDLASSEEIKKLLREEKNKDLFPENSVLDPSPYAHTAAMVIGKIIIDSHPKTWPEKIINSNSLSL